MAQKSATTINAWTGSDFAGLANSPRQWNISRQKTYSRSQPLTRCPTRPRSSEEIFGDLEHEWRVKRTMKESLPGNLKGKVEVQQQKSTRHAKPSAGAASKSTRVRFYESYSKVQDADEDVFKLPEWSKRVVKKPKKPVFALPLVPLLPASDPAEEMVDLNEHRKCSNAFVEGKMEYVVIRKKRWLGDRADESYSSPPLEQQSVQYLNDIEEEEDEATIHPSALTSSQTSNALNTSRSRTLVSSDGHVATRRKTAVQTSTPVSLEGNVSLFPPNQSSISADRNSLPQRRTSQNAASSSTSRSGLRNKNRIDANSTLISSINVRRTMSVKDVINSQSEPRTSLLPRFSCESTSSGALLNSREERSFLRSMDCVSVRAKFFEMCGQSSPLKLSQVFSKAVLKTSKKIGEGSFGEVFLMDFDGLLQAVKIIPIEGSIKYNRNNQLKFREILLEMTVAQKLSELRNGDKDCCSTFMEIFKFHCVVGKYPALMMKQWDEFDANKKSENDNPSLFSSDQLFTTIVGEHCGQSLEDFEGLLPAQAWSVVWQMSLALAVAENAMEFEHRDLHCGNIMVQPTAETDVHYVVNGIDLTVPTHDDHILYVNLADDESLFEGKGLQYDIYRRMRSFNKNCWKPYKPETNICWLAFVSRTLAETTVRNRRPDLRERADVRRLHALATEIEIYSSAANFVASRYLKEMTEEAESSLNWSKRRPTNRQLSQRI